MKIYNKENNIYHLSVCIRSQLSSRRAFEYHCAQKWVVGAPTPTGEIYFSFRQ